MKRFLFYTLGSIAIGGAVWGAIFYWKNLRGLEPALLGPPQDIKELINEVGSGTPDAALSPLKLSPGFSISVFAKDLPGARVMALDAFGNMWVSQTPEGKITLLEIKDRTVPQKSEIFLDLKKPHGLAFDPENSFTLYFAEEDKISRVAVYSERLPEKVIDLPTGGNHFTRTIGFGPDNALYVSIGSSCDVCQEKDERRAKIFKMDKDGRNFKEFARGLRNAVFFTWSPFDNRMWATEMGRDFLGDNLPPDEINIVEEGKNYGWPICYGKNIHDTDFDKNTYIRNPCMEPFEAPSFINIQAHSAPLGLAFFPKEGWPKEYSNNLLVAYHGSWNRSEPTGYKIVRYKFDDQGKYLGQEDFITGWLTKDGRALDRPVDILITSGGIIYISDDKAGVIYKVIHKD